jgi:hypothetical protein
MQNISRNTEKEISVLFEVAMIKLAKIDDNSNKEKKNVVQELAKGLEVMIAINTICMEIVVQLRGKVSERFVRESLDEKYKQEHRVKNAKKQNDLAASTPLNSPIRDEESEKIIIDTSGNTLSEPKTPTNETTDHKTDAGSIETSLDVNERNVARISDTGSIIDFEFSLPFEEVRHYMESMFRENNGVGKVYFHGTMDTRTGKVTSVFTGNSSSNSTNNSAGVLENHDDENSAHDDTLNDSDTYQW